MSVPVSGVHRHMLSRGCVSASLLYSTVRTQDSGAASSLRAQNLCQHQAHVRLRLVLRLPVPTIRLLYPAPLPPAVRNSPGLFTQCQLLYAAVVLFKILYCKILKKFVFFMHLCEYYKPITAQYYIANCVGSVPRLTSLELQTYCTI